MEYSDIIVEIKDLNSNDFNMDSFRNLGIICKRINNIYDDELKEKRIDATVRYATVKEYFNAIVFDLLKEKLEFEDEVINKIIYYINFAHRILDIYVLDGNVIIKATSDINEDNKTISYFVSDSFIDITSKNFVKGMDLKVYKDFFTSALDKALKVELNDKIFSDKLISNNGNINYNIDNLNIYSNKSLKEIMRINIDVTKEVAKLFIKHNNDELYYYDMKIHYGYFELAHNDYKIKIVSEILDKKNKIKKI